MVGMDSFIYGYALIEIRVQELCESRGGRPGLPVSYRPVDVKQH